MFVVYILYCDVLQGKVQAAKMILGDSLDFRIQDLDCVQLYTQHEAQSRRESLLKGFALFVPLFLAFQS